jgi:hypothetical protein
MTGTDCVSTRHSLSRTYLNHFVYNLRFIVKICCKDHVVSITVNIILQLHLRTCR